MKRKKSPTGYENILVERAHPDEPLGLRARLEFWKNEAQKRSQSVNMLQMETSNRRRQIEELQLALTRALAVIDVLVKVVDRG